MSSKLAPPVLADHQTLHRRVYQWWLKENGGMVGDRAALAHILAVRLQCAKSEVGRTLKGKRTKEVVYWDAIWTYLKDMMVCINCGGEQWLIRHPFEARLT